MTSLGSIGFTVGGIAFGVLSIYLVILVMFYLPGCWIDGGSDFRWKSNQGNFRSGLGHQVYLRGYATAKRKQEIIDNRKEFSA